MSRTQSQIEQTYLIDRPETVNDQVDVATEEMLVNMGPQHPSTHGVLRIVLRTDGEVVLEAVPHIGYLHRCAEKIGENLAYYQYLPYTDRMDYVAGMNENWAFCRAAEKLANVEVTRRAEFIRIIIGELNRIASHLVTFGTYGLDIGAFTPGRIEPIDKVAGHIPRAVNHFFQRNLDRAGLFRTPEELRTEWRDTIGAAAPDHVVCYCGSGVTACHNLLALEHAGLSGAKLYPGSWSEWSSDPLRPIER